MALDYPTKTIGKTEHVTVMIHPGMYNDAGKRLCQEMLAVVEIYYMRMKNLFAYKGDMKVNLVIIPLSNNHIGNGGYHYPARPEIYSDVLMSADKKSYNRMFTSFVFCAELLEMITEQWPTEFWNSSTDACEALSRVVANSFAPGVLERYETVPNWINSTRKDYISTGVGFYNGVTIGCNACMLFYLRKILKKTDWADIARAGAPSMEQVFHKLTGRAGGYKEMLAAVNKIYKPGIQIAVVPENENIFD